MLLVSKTITAWSTRPPTCQNARYATMALLVVKAGGACARKAGGACARRCTSVGAGRGAGVMGTAPTGGLGRMGPAFSYETAKKGVRHYAECPNLAP